MNARRQRSRELKVLFRSQIRNKEGEISRSFERSNLKLLHASMIQRYLGGSQHWRHLKVRQ